MLTVLLSVLFGSIVFKGLTVVVYLAWLANHPFVACMLIGELIACGRTVISIK